MKDNSPKRAARALTYRRQKSAHQDVSSISYNQPPGTKSAKKNQYLAGIESFPCSSHSL